MVYIFLISVVIVFYTYIGYPLILFIMVLVKRLTFKSNVRVFVEDELPEITLLVACYNEADILADKVKNTLELRYPTGKLHIYFVTDGSDDNSHLLLSKYQDIKVFHKEERKGKNAAIDRVMTYVRTQVVIFSDANAFLNKDALINMVRHYKNPKVGGVAGEKRIFSSMKDAAAGSGEGAYWKYESLLKKWDSELNTIVGAAGELFSVRTSLYTPVPSNVIIEDFRLSMNIAVEGYKIVYEPEAYAIETASESTEEEYKRKVRISAGGLMEVTHFKNLLNIYKYKLLSFQYVSHRMLRWTLAPLSLLSALLSNLFLLSTGREVFVITLAIQFLFYLLAMLGYILRLKKIKVKYIFIPYYFTFMHVAVFHGLNRIIFGKQSNIWAKSRRSKFKLHK